MIASSTPPQPLCFAPAREDASSGVAASAHAERAPERRWCSTCKYAYDAAIAFEGDRKTCRACARSKARAYERRRREGEGVSRAVSSRRATEANAPSAFDASIRLRWLDDEDGE